jgi:hypothetical protein
MATGSKYFEPEDALMVYFGRGNYSDLRWLHFFLLVALLDHVCSSYCTKALDFENTSQCIDLVLAKDRFPYCSNLG